MSKIYIHKLTDDLQGVLADGFRFLGESAVIRPGSSICIKPNLTFPTFRKGVMTNPEMLESVILFLKNFTDRITVCESDSGGYNRFSMDEVFARTGIAEFAKRHGVRILNMSRLPSRSIPVRAGFRKLSVPLPTLLLDETDHFITMPVPKVHANALVSLSLKNQWGVIQEPALRLRLHPYFKEVIYAVNKSLPPSLAIFDGKYGLTRNGPMRGDVVELNWLLLSDNLFVADAVVSELIGFNPKRVPHLRYAMIKENISSLEGVAFNCDFRSFKQQPFYLRRDWTDYPGVVTFNSRLMAYLGYESSLAKPLHWLLYKFREPFY